MKQKFSIKVHKEYFNFACAHFLIFKDGSREMLHGHNYRVYLAGHGHTLNDDMLFDFLNIKPIVREVCNSLDHKLLLPGENPMVTINEKENSFEFICPDKSSFSFPKQDVLIMPLQNISAERLAVYIAKEIKNLLHAKFNFKFDRLEIEVEETPGQSAVCIQES